ncbi:MAG: hypothetical protein Kow0047_29880 [Anaerolineae bacterium]
MKVQRAFAHRKIALMAATEQGVVISYIRYGGALHLIGDTNTIEGDDLRFQAQQVAPCRMRRLIGTATTT